jgi:hypothetical protein
MPACFIVLAGVVLAGAEFLFCFSVSVPCAVHAVCTRMVGGRTVSLGHAQWVV